MELIKKTAESHLEIPYMYSGEDQLKPDSTKNKNDKCFYSFIYNFHIYYKSR